MRKTDKNIRYSYKEYKKESKNPLDIKDYIELCNGYNQFLMDKVFEGHEVVLPKQMGSMYIVGTKTKLKFTDGKPNLAPDWVKTKKLWDECEECKEKKQLVYHTNAHSGGIRYKLMWSKKRMPIKNKTLYAFRLTRAHKRRIHDGIKNGNEYFIR